MKIVISTDSHSTGNLAFMKYGVITARRGWIEKKDVINTLPADEFLGALRQNPGAVPAHAPKAQAARRKSA